MNSFFIYPSRYLKENSGGYTADCTVTIVFCERSELEMSEVQGAIKFYHENNYQTDEILIICGNYNSDLVKSIFIDKKEDAFKHIPKINIEHLSENLYLLIFDKMGKVRCGNSKKLPKIDVLEKILAEGLTYIFKDRGGLIEASGNAHHFVFPSGKHSDKFLRTGNILLHSSEIYFIAFHLLRYYKIEEHKRILCDTSSINTVAFALLDLKRKLVIKSFKSIPIISFSSYEGIFSNQIKFFHNSLILVSSSTSANIIEKLTRHDGRINRLDIAILYFLGPNNLYKLNKGNILCDLTKSDSNPYGIEFYDTYTEEDCIFCNKGSYAIEVKGDVFLLEKPKIRKIMLKITDAPKGLSSFVDRFKSTTPNEDNILKVNFKDGNSSPNSKYEVYFDMFYLLSNIQKNKYLKYAEKLDDFINQYIPNSVKYLICLPDVASEELGAYILEKIKDNHDLGKLPVIKLFNEIPHTLPEKNESGSVVIVASCISSGKNLLFLSRALREFEKLRIVYFIGLTTTSDEESFNILKSNLTQGLYGKNIHSFVEVDNFYCNKDSKNTSWLREKEFIKELSEYFAEKNFIEFDLTYFSNRVKIIDESMGNQSRGLANKLFLPNTSGEELAVRKSFAFWNFDCYSEKVSQADVYFTISAIINKLRYSKSQEQTLTQTEFVRNLIDPGNFHRYNDGVIQASILRSSYPSEICYHVDEKLSAYMLTILEKIITDHKSPQGEGLLEFLYAIAIQKLTLKKDHMRKISMMLGDIEHALVKIFKFQIDEFIIKIKPSSAEQIRILETEIDSLKLKLAGNGS
ncbi:hypothetical protein ABIB40_000225 [Pedobacter sp. UYP30]|uniref:hypothetical protein n=1 Tax=Pedobacter sp. UYP30 TaxID=1756400 RepID=UPI003395CEF9